MAAKSFFCLGTQMIACSIAKLARVSFSTQGGGSMPALAFGTAGVQNSSVILSAINVGFKHIDTAKLYGNHAAVREAMEQSGRLRDEIFLTTKVSYLPGGLYGAWSWILDYIAGYGPGVSELISKGREKDALGQSLKELGVSSVDLCLLHSPFAAGMLEFLAAYLPHRLGRHKPVSWSGFAYFGHPLRWLLRRLVDILGADSSVAANARRNAWAALEDAQASGLCRYIGVSNYDLSLLRELETFARVLPAVNQLEFHPRYQAKDTVAYCESKGIAVMAYGNSVSMTSRNVMDLAGQRGIAPAQIALAWTLGRGAVAVARSSRAEGMRQILAASTISLTREEQEAMQTLDEGVPFFYDLQAIVKGESLEEQQKSDL